MSQIFYRDSYQGETVASKTTTFVWLCVRPHFDLPRFFRGEFDLSGGGMVTLKIIRNERLIEF